MIHFFQLFDIQEPTFRLFIVDETQLFSRQLNWHILFSGRCIQRLFIWKIIRFIATFLQPWFSLFYGWMNSFTNQRRKQLFSFIFNAHKVLKLGLPLLNFQRKVNTFFPLFFFAPYSDSTKSFLLRNGGNVLLGAAYLSLIIISFQLPKSDVGILNWSSHFLSLLNHGRVVFILFKLDGIVVLWRCFSGRCFHPDAYFGQIELYRLCHFIIL